MNPVHEAVGAALGAVVTKSRAVGGGSIASAERLELDDGRTVFVKSLSQQAGDFREEAAGLRALRETNTLRVPEVLTHGEAVAIRYLVLEWIEPGRPAADHAWALGRGLAELHRRSATERCGFDHDNHCGATPQPNPWSDEWAAFWRDRRLGHQLSLARSRGRADAELVRLVEAVMARTEDAVAPTRAEPMSLLHGDLWGGNVLSDEDGSPVLIDPAVYYGHREADLGMTIMFGGFDEDFYSGYDETWPLVSGWRQRLPLYALYHALNHLNLFGGGYRATCMTYAEQALAA